MAVRDFFIRLFDRRATKQTGGNPQNPSYWVEKYFGSTGNTYAGKHVDEQSALTSPAVWRAVNLVAQNIGSLPLHMYERNGDRTKTKAFNHQLYKVLHDEPNPEQSAMEFRAMLQAHAITWGRAHAEIAVDKKGRIQLWPLIPDRVQFTRDKESQKPRYKVYLPDGGIKTLLPDEVFTLKGLGYGLNHSYNVIRLFQESIGLTLAVEEFGARFFGNGASMGGALEHPGRLDEDSLKNLRESMENRHGGLENSHRLLILEEGMKYHEIAVPPEKAQFLDTRKFQINDVARIIGVPPHKLAEMTNSTYSNIEHQSIEYIQDTIGPWCVSWEQALKRQLLTETEKQKYFFRHNLAGLQRGDFKTRMDGYSIGRQWGWLSANDIREMEDMNPIEDGDIYLLPLNMVPAAQAGDERNYSIYEPILKNAISDITNRERQDIAKKAKVMIKNNDPGEILKFQVFVNEFYRDHPEFVRRKLEPIAESIQKQTGSDMEPFLMRFILTHNADSLSAVYQALNKDDPVNELNNLFDSWDSRIEKETQAEMRLLEGGHYENRA